MQVVAEGIEESAQLTQLQSLGCEYGQGYLFSKPLTANDAAALLATASSADSTRAHDDPNPTDCINHTSMLM